MPCSRDASTAIPEGIRPGIRHWSTGSADALAVAAMIDYLVDEVRVSRPMCAYLLRLARAELDTVDPATFKPAEHPVGLITS